MTHRPTRLLALLATAAVVAAGCGVETDDEVTDALEDDVDLSASESPSPEPSEEPTPSEPASSEPASPEPTTSDSPTPDAGDVSWVDTPSGERQLDEGVFLLGLSRDGSAAIVTAPDPEGVACEEAEPRSLQLLDLDSGERRPAIGPELGVNAFTIGQDGEALVWSSCEGAVLSAWTAQATPDGQFESVTRLPLPDQDDDLDMATAVALAPSGPGYLVAGGEPEGAEVAVIDDGGDIVEDAEPIAGVVRTLVPSRIGLYGVPEGAEELAVHELRSGIALPGYGEVAATLDGRTVVVAGDAGVGSLSAQPATVGEVTPWVQDGEYGALALYGEDRAAVVRDVTGARELVAVGPDGVIEVVDVGISPIGEVAVAPDGSRLVYVRASEQQGPGTLVVRDR